MKTITSNWHFMRVLRLGISIVALTMAWTQRDAVLALIGVFLLFTALANIGCCGANGCAVNYQTDDKTKEVDYEEVKVTE